MSQTAIDTFFKSRKRATSELISSAKCTTKKLFAQDCGFSTPIRSPVRHVVTRENRDDNEAADVRREETSPKPTPFPSEEQETTPVKCNETRAEEPKLTPTRSAAEQEKLRKELTLGEFKRVVRQSRKYTALKRALEKHNATVSRLQGNLKPKKLFGNDTTTNVVDRSATYPVELAAFQRYEQLLADGDDSLILPPKYATLKEIFNGVETIVRLLTDRKELITFKRICNDVQKMTRRNFTEQHMGMIKTVYPEAYELKYEMVKLPFSRDETVEVVIEMPACHSAGSTERKNMFSKLLLEITKLHHQEFLESLDPPLVVAIDQIKRWHPLYDLNKVPNIVVAPIPRPTLTKEAPVSVKDFLEKTKRLVSCNVAAPELMEVRKIESKSSPAVNPIPALQKALKGVPKSLLEKIRAKKAARTVESVTQTPEEAKERVMLSRLPELAKIMRIVFVNEKKGILPQELVLTKISHSFKEKMSKAEIVEHLKLMSKHVPGWLNFCNVRDVPYMRLSKDADMSRVVGRLRKLAEPN